MLWWLAVAAHVVESSVCVVLCVKKRIPLGFSVAWFLLVLTFGFPSLETIVKLRPRSKAAE